MDESSDKTKPDWWKKNQELREQLDLPSYNPPRFEEGTYLHTIINEVEKELDYKITIIGKNVNYLDKWRVKVDGETVFRIDRRRDDKGNTVFEITPDEFISRIRQK
jgi:hypothetical protein